VDGEEIGRLRALKNWMRITRRLNPCDCLGAPAKGRCFTLLQHIIEEARRRVIAIELETGSMNPFRTSRRLYAKFDSKLRAFVAMLKIPIAFYDRELLTIISAGATLADLHSSFGRDKSVTLCTIN